MLSLIILLGVFLVIGYFLGRGKAGERISNWYAGWRAPKEEAVQEAETEGEEGAEDVGRIVNPP
jgi:hypothetical protein